jgi:WD40 repeat protein
MASGKIVLSLEGHTHHVNAIAFRSDARVLATAGADGTVVTWDLLIGERKKKIEGWSKEVTSLQFIGASDQIAAASGDNRLRLVTDSGSEVRNISDVPDYLQSAAVSPDGSLLLAGGEDSILRLWDATNGSPLAVFKP